MCIDRQNGNVIFRDIYASGEHHKENQGNDGSQSQHDRCLWRERRTGGDTDTGGDCRWRAAFLLCRT